jgi:hypothetical protein
VLGSGHSSALLARVLDRDVAKVHQSLAEAERAVLIELRGSHDFIFSHELVRDALRAQLSRERLGEIHRGAADAIEAFYSDWLEPHLAELSVHLFEARPLVDDARVSRAAREAGRQALGRCAFSEAVRHLRYAAETQTAATPDAARERCDVLLDLAEGETLTRDGPRAKESLSEATALARRLADGPRLALLPW